jgi:putative transcriptional regulator
MSFSQPADSMESMLDIYPYWSIIPNGKRAFHFHWKGWQLKNRLEEIRKQRGIKQEELADALEVSRQTIGSLENGRYNPSITLAFKIARFFGMTIEEIFIYEDDTK